MVPPDAPNTAPFSPPAEPEDQPATDASPMLDGTGQEPVDSAVPAERPAPGGWIPVPGETGPPTDSSSQLRLYDARPAQYYDESRQLRDAETSAALQRFMSVELEAAEKVLGRGSQ